MSIIRSSHRGTAVVRLSGRIDATNAKELETVLLEGVAPRRAFLVVDMSELTAMTSAGLRSLLMAAKRAQPQGSRIVLSAVPSAVRRLFDVSAFSSLFEIHADMDAAVAARH